MNAALLIQLMSYKLSTFCLSNFIKFLSVCLFFRIKLKLNKTKHKNVRQKTNRIE